MKSEIREIKKIKVWSVGKVFLIIGLIMGLLQGITYSLQAQQLMIANPEIATMSFADVSAAGNTQAMLGFWVIKLGYWLVLIMPITLAVLYFLGAMLGALIYNLVARWMGGIKVVLN